MANSRSRPDERPHWERTPEENAAAFEAFLDSGECWPHPEPEGDDTARRQALGDALQVGIDQLDRGEGITFDSMDDAIAYLRKIGAEARAAAARARSE